MADPRFFTNHGPFMLGTLAERTGTTLNSGADPDLPICDVAPLDRAGPNDISFLDNVKYADQFRISQAGACFVKPKFASEAPASMALLISEDPYRAHSKAAQLFYPYEAPHQTIAATAFIDESAVIGEHVTIGPGAVIGARAEIGDGALIGANAVIHDGVIIGAQTRIGALSSISHAVIGQQVTIHRGVHIGQDGFGFAMSREGHLKVPQLGRVVIEEDVEIGAGTCIDRGTGPDTFIGAGTKIDNLVQIGHNVHIGRGAIIVAQTGIAGSTRVGDGAVLGGQVGVAGHLKIGPGAKLAARAGVMQDIPAGAAYGGSPAVPARDWHRQTVALARLIKKGTEATNSE